MGRLGQLGWLGWLERRRRLGRLGRFGRGGKLDNWEIGKLGVFKVGGNGTRMDAFPGLQKRALKFQSLGSKFPRALEN